MCFSSLFTPKSKKNSGEQPGWSPACLQCHEISIFLFISDHFLSGFSELMRVTSCDRCRFPSLSQTSSACCRVTVPRCSRNPFDFKVVLTPIHNKVSRVPALLIAHTLVTVTILWSPFCFFFHKMKKQWVLKQRECSVTVQHLFNGRATRWRKEAVRADCDFLLWLVSSLC